jgi:hypothetical protein
MFSKIKIAMLGLLVVSSSLVAQPTENEKLNTLVENCTNALNHENDGVVESAIYVSLQFKNRYPEQNDKNFVQALDRIANTSENARVTYKAQLAKIYFKNSDWFSAIEVNSIFDEQEVFEKIAEKVNTVLLAVN